METPQAMSVTSAGTNLRRMAPISLYKLHMVRVLQECFSSANFCEILCIVALKLRRLGWRRCSEDLKAADLTYKVTGLAKPQRRSWKNLRRYVI